MESTLELYQPHYATTTAYYTMSTPTVNVALITRLIDKWPATVAYDLDKLPKVVTDRIATLVSEPDWKEAFYGDVKTVDHLREQRGKQLEAAGLNDDIDASVWLPEHYRVKLVRTYLGRLVDTSADAHKLVVSHTDHTSNV